MNQPHVGTNCQILSWRSWFRVTVDKGSKSRVQWNRTFLLVKSFKLLPRPLDESPGPRQIKLWFSLHDIILEGKSIGPDKKKSLKKSSWFGESNRKLRSKVAQFFCFNICFYPCYKNYVRMEDMLFHSMDWGHCWAHTSSLIFWPILQLAWLICKSHNVVFRRSAFSALPPSPWNGDELEGKVYWHGICGYVVVRMPQNIGCIKNENRK